MFSFRGIDVRQANFELLILYENGEGVAVCDFDDFAFVDPTGRLLVPALKIRDFNFSSVTRF